jgi:hypothetical protein
MISCPSCPIHITPSCSINIDVHCKQIGAGTGKSRLLEEFRDLLTSSLSPVSTSTGETKSRVVPFDLKKRIDHAIVFRLTFGNGTLWNASDEKGSAGKLIGNRMAHQLLNNSAITYSHFRDTNNYTIETSLLLLHQITKTPREEQTVILLVDELSILPHVSGAASSLMTDVMAAVTAYVNNAPEFIIAAMGGTVYTPVNEWLHTSRQLRVPLTPPCIDHTSIIKTVDPVIRLLADDMGGHGRALERLAEVVLLSRYHLSNISFLFLVDCSNSCKNINGIQQKTIHMIVLLQVLIMFRSTQY